MTLTERMNEERKKWMKERIHKQTNLWTDEQTSERRYKRANEGTNERTKGQTKLIVNERTNVRTKLQKTEQKKALDWVIPPFAKSPHGLRFLSLSHGHSKRLKDLRNPDWTSSHRDRKW